MSKKNENNAPKTVKYIKGSITETISANVNKHGVIKGSNKKETKMLKLICNHHAKNKKGKTRPRLIGAGDNKKECTLCNQVIVTDIYDEQEVRKRVNQLQAIMSQTAYMIEAANLGKESAIYVANMQIALNNFPKVYNKITRVIKKNEETKHKKNKASNKGVRVTESLGSWM